MLRTEYKDRSLAWWVAAVLVASGWLSSTRAWCEETTAATAAARLTLREGDSLVFLGDSITAQCLYTQFLENYFYTRYPSLNLTIHNAGVSGDTIADTLHRFDRDVAAQKPQYVFILLGMNDAAGKTFQEELFERYRNDLKILIEKTRAIGAKPILLSPTMYDLPSALRTNKPDSRGRGGYYNSVLSFYTTWLREYAQEEGLLFVDLHSILNHYTQLGRRKEASYSLVPDGIHPDANGQIIMAYALISQLGLSTRVSTIDVAKGSGGEVIAKVTGGTLDQGRYDADGLSFTFHPASLPYAIPSQAQEGAALIPLGHRMSYEALYIHDLEPGEYEVRINDRPIGIFPAKTLESKIEIQNNEETPQYQQAAQVAALNARRNTEYVVPLRDWWRARKTLLRTEKELQLAPNDVQLKKRLLAYQRKLTDFDAQVSVLERGARHMEAEIHRTNQPQALRFEFRKQ